MDDMLPIKNGTYTDGWLEFTVWIFQPTRSPWTWLFLAIDCVTFGKSILFQSPKRSEHECDWVLRVVSLRLAMRKSLCQLKFLSYFLMKYLMQYMKRAPHRLWCSKHLGVFFEEQSISIKFSKTLASNPEVCNFYDWTPMHKKYCWFLAPC